MDPQLAIKIRAKKLGILLRDARSAANRSLKDCGEAIGVSGSTMGAYEKGERSPSLPELEVLSFFLKVPLEQFWQDQVLETEEDILEELQIEKALQKRDTAIGQILETKRLELGLTYKEIDEQTGISPRRMKKFEMGENALPIPELELLTNCLGLSMHSFREYDTVMGKWIAAQAGVGEFMQLPTDVQVFVTTPVNLPYIHLAEKLSKLKADQLRDLAEGILEITI